MKIQRKYVIGFGLLLFISNQSFCQGIYNTANIVVSGNAFVTVIDGSFSNNGNLSPASGTFVIGGTASGTSFIGGTNATAFYHLTINKTAANALLAGDITVDGNLFMQTGNLDLNLHNINLGNASGTIVNENNNAHITGTNGGYVSKTMNLVAPALVNPGNLGILISSAATLGNTVIKRGHQQQTLPGGLSINRYFDITPANNTALSASLQLYYMDDELAGIPESNLAFYKSEDNGATFTLAGRDNSDLVNNWVLKNNIDQLSRWTLGFATNSSLPINLISFTANLINRQTSLQWITAQEINSNYFDVQRSADGIAFDNLLSVAAKGNSTVQSVYTALDPNPLTGINYYRLKEVDKDGTFQYSPVVNVRLSNESSWFVYPNPASDICYLNVTVTTAKTTSIGLYDINGKLLQQKENVQFSSGNNHLEWNISKLSAGMYFLKSTDLSMPVINVIKK